MGHAARRRLPSRGSLGSPFLTFPGALRRDDGHHVPLGSLRVSLASRDLACSRGSCSPLRARDLGEAPRTTPGPVVTRSPTPGLWSRRPMALPRSRVPLVETCPARRPRGCPASSPSRTQDCCLPGRAHRRLTTTLPLAGLPHAVCLLAPPGSVRPLTGRHAGSRLTGWLSFHQVGLEPYWLAPTGKQQPISWAYAQFQGFGLPLARARRGSAQTRPAGPRVHARPSLQLPHRPVVAAETGDRAAEAPGQARERLEPASHQAPSI